MIAIAASDGHGSVKSKGDWAEGVAEKHLCSAGLTVVTRNYRCPSGELDLIVRAASLHIFVEVRYRADARFGNAAESIDRRKRVRLIKAAQHYIQTTGLDCACRFDVIVIDGQIDTPTIQWIPNAFGDWP